MRIVLEPTVTLMWDVRFHDHPTLHLPPDGDDATRVGAFAAKTCYRSFGEDGRPSCEANQRRIIEEHHGKILQHINIGVHVSGVSRALGNELITHTAGVVVSQESTRFVGQEDAALVLEPWQAEVYRHNEDMVNAVIAAGDPEQLTLLASVIEPATRRKVAVVAEAIRAAARAFESYGRQDRELQLICQEEDVGHAERTLTQRKKWARGKARNSLPLGLETSLVMTANVRAWRHFVEMRSNRHAEAEIRRLCKHLVLVLQPVCPLYWEDYFIEQVDGLPEFDTKHRKL